MIRDYLPICDTETTLALAGVEFDELSDQQQQAFTLVRRGIEQQISGALGSPLMQPVEHVANPYVEYLPIGGSAVSIPSVLGAESFLDEHFGSGVGHEFLPLGVGWVRSVSQVKQSQSAATEADWAGVAADATSHYALELDCKLPDASVVSQYGNLVRLVGSWNRSPRSVRVTYLAGFTTEEIASYFPALALEVSECIADRFQKRMSRQGVGNTQLMPGYLKAETLGKHRQEWAVSRGGLPEGILEALAPLRVFKL
jgi:hypothetical protein